MVEVAAADECVIEAADVIDDGAEATVSSGDEVRAPELEEYAVCVLGDEANNLRGCFVYLCLLFRLELKTKQNLLDRFRFKCISFDRICIELLKNTFEYYYLATGYGAEMSYSEMK